MNRTLNKKNNKIHELLRAQNYRITRSRKAMINVFLIKKWLTIPELTMELNRSLGSSFNIGSMYNNLNLFVKAGILIRSHIHKSQIVYELGNIFLLHFICDKCQRIIHYHFHKSNPIINRTQLNQKLKNIGWSPSHNIKLEVSSTCGQCPHSMTKH